MKPPVETLKPAHAILEGITRDVNESDCLSKTQLILKLFKKQQPLNCFHRLVKSVIFIQT